MPPDLEQRRHDHRRRLVRTMRRTTGPIAEPGGAGRVIAVDPLVRGFPTDAVPARQLGDVEHVALIIRDEPHALIHEQQLLPRHRVPRGECGRMCYPCPRTVLLPFSPDRTA